MMKKTKFLAGVLGLSMLVSVAQPVQAMQPAYPGSGGWISSTRNMFSELSKSVGKGAALGVGIAATGFIVGGSLYGAYRLKGFFSSRRAGGTTQLSEHLPIVPVAARAPGVVSSRHGGGQAPLLQYVRPQIELPGVPDYLPVGYSEEDLQGNIAQIDDLRVTIGNELQLACGEYKRVLEEQATRRRIHGLGLLGVIQENVLGAVPEDGQLVEIQTRCEMLRRRIRECEDDRARYRERLVAARRARDGRTVEPLRVQQRREPLRDEAPPAEAAGVGFSDRQAASVVGSSSLRLDSDQSQRFEPVVQRPSKSLPWWKSIFASCRGCRRR